MCVAIYGAAADERAGRNHNSTMLQIPSSERRPGRVLDRGDLLALLACVTLLLGIGAASAWQSEANSTALRAARQTREQRDRVASLMLSAQEAESSQRGYLLTLDPDYLTPFVAAERSAPAALAALANDWSGDPRNVTLRDVVVAKFAELRETVRLAQSGDQAGAMRIVRSNAGNDAMQVIRQTVAALETELDAKLAGQVAGIVRGSRLLVAIELAGLVMIFALAGLIALGLRRTVATLRTSQAQTATAYGSLEQVNEGLDEMVRQRTTDLSNANEEIQRFAYIVSHDLRAPLVNIMGFTSEMEQASAMLLQYASAEGTPDHVREVVANEIPEALRFIRSSTTKMDGLIKAILRLSREGRRVLAPEPLDMAVTLRTLMDSMEHQASSKGATVNIGSVPAITADRMAVEQVFGNVLENALKYLKPGRPGVISVTGRVDGAMACFEVTDNGRGIAARDYERVFDLFRRAGDQSVPGEGIGLAHVRALVRRLGGTIDCRSTLEIGSTFIICLPQSPQRARETVA